MLFPVNLGGSLGGGNGGGGGATIAFDFLWRSGDNGAWQGVATDGTNLYATAGSGPPTAEEQWTLYKLDMDGNPVASRDTSADGPGTHTQINGIYYNSADSKLYVSANNYPNEPAAGWVLIYNASDLSFDTHHSLGANWSEMVSLWDGSWWQVNASAHEIRQFNTSFSLVQAHSLPDTDPGGLYWQGIVVVNDQFWLNHHDDGLTAGLTRGYDWTGSGFTAASETATRPTANAGQGFFYDGGDVWWAERWSSAGVARIVKSTAVETELDTDPSWDDVVISALLHGANGQTQIGDQSKSGHTITFRGDAEIQGDVAELDGTGDYLTSSDSDDWHFGSGDFTIEWWGSFANQSQRGTLLSQYESLADERAWYLLYAGNESPDKLRFGWYTDGTAGSHVNFDASWEPTVDQQYAICAERSGNTFRLYVDGALIASTTSATSIFNAATSMRAGCLFTTGAPGNVMNGTIEAYRITKGVARYASDGGYTVPTLPLPVN